MRPTVWAIAGMSGSGKSTLAERLVREHGASVLCTDDYYRPLGHLTFEERCAVNFDHPDAIDAELLAEHIGYLREGIAVEARRYDFSRHTRHIGGHTVEPAPLVIVEGIFPLCYAAVRDLCDRTVFVDTPAHLCLERRIARDVAERGRTREEVEWRWAEHVYPSFQRYVRPFSELADTVLVGEGDVAFV